MGKAPVIVTFSNDTATAASTCSQCRHGEAEHHVAKKDWLNCLHAGCNCEVYKGFVAWNEVPEDEKEGLIVAMSEPAKKKIVNAIEEAVKNGYASKANAARIVGDDGFPKPIPIWFIAPGLVHYEYLNNGKGATVLVDKPALDKMLASIVGKPIVNWDHRDVSPEDFKNGTADGIVCGDPVFDAAKGWFRCDALIWDEDTRKNIVENNYSVSCEYHVKEWGNGGTHNNIPYEREVLDGEYKHIAIVNNPRYERARIMNSQGGRTMMKLLQWIRKGTDDVRNSVEVDPAKTHLEIDGQEIALDNAVEAYRAAEKEKAAAKKRAEEDAAAALANSKKTLSDEDTITVDGKSVKIADLKNSYAAKLANEAAEKMEKDHEDGKHKDKEVENCSMCNTAKNAKADEAKKRKSEEIRNSHQRGEHSGSTDGCSLCEKAAADKLDNAARTRNGEFPTPTLRTVDDGLKEGRARYGTPAAK